MTKEQYAALLPHAVKYFIVSAASVCAGFGLGGLTRMQPATSLGGVESLMEQRVHSDPGADPRLIRISVGVEDLEVRSQRTRLCSSAAAPAEPIFYGRTSRMTCVGRSRRSSSRPGRGCSVRRGCCTRNVWSCAAVVSCRSLVTGSCASFVPSVGVARSEVRDGTLSRCV